MTSNEYSDVKQLYKLSIAYDSFTEIARACEYLINRRTPSTAPEYFAMAVGIVTLYARPFTKTNERIGAVSTKLVPPEFKKLHSELIDIRNTAFAHTDFSAQMPREGTERMTEVLLVYNWKSVESFGSRPISEAVPLRLESFSSRPIFLPVLLPVIKALSESLAQRVAQERDNFLTRIHKALGPINASDIGKEFKLNVGDESGPIVPPAAERNLEKYPMIRPKPEVS